MCISLLTSVFCLSSGFIGYASVFHQVVADHDIDDVEDDQLYYTKIFLNKQKRVGQTTSNFLRRIISALNSRIFQHHKNICCLFCYWGINLHVVQWLSC